MIELQINGFKLRRGLSREILNIPKRNTHDLSRFRNHRHVRIILEANVKFYCEFSATGKSETRRFNRFGTRSVKAVLHIAARESAHALYIFYGSTLTQKFSL